METIKATILNVWSDKGTWAAIKAKNNETGEIFGANGTIVCPVVGEEIKMTGEWVNHPTYGRQFRVESASKAKPNDRNGILAYLCAGFIKGVGPKKAVAILDRFGDKTLEVIEKDYMRLADIKGITPNIAQVIHDCHMQNNIYMELVDLLKPSITDKQIADIYDRYGKNAVEKLKKNPYILINDLYGVGFKRADAIASAVGISAASPVRVRAGISYCLKEKGESEGHCYVSSAAIEKALAEIIGEDVGINVIADNLMAMQEQGEIIIEDENTIYLRSLYYSEVSIANCVKTRMNRSPRKEIPMHCIESALSQMEKKSGFTIEGKQREAVEKAFQKCLFVITGGPGTGKTTITKAIVSAWERAGHSESSIAMCAPTGKASRRMTEVTGIQAKTIHSLLEFSNDGFAYNSENKLPHSLIIVDESSMLDIYLAKALFEAVRDDVTMILIGDIDQLPPIGAGNVFRDLVELPCVSTVKLNLSHRQHGKIAINANKVNTGNTDFELDESFQFVFEEKDHAKLQQYAVEQYLKLVNEYGVEEVCLLAPMRQRGETAVNVLNPILREKVNPAGKAAEVALNGRILRVGDRVMQIKNRLKDGVANGDIGTVQTVCSEYITVAFDSGNILEYLADELNQLVLAYSMTVHKSQGSEYKACVVVQSNEHYIMLQRNLLYTALTRAKEKVVLVGNKWAVGRAVNTVKAIERNTKLKNRIGFHA